LRDVHLGNGPQGLPRGRSGDLCRLVGPNTLVPFPVSECTGYTDRRCPDSPFGRRIGFVSAAALRETGDVEIVPVTSSETKED